ncbi:hypothetical protein Z052_00975 [Halorubrum sp. C191]|nr:hypothetical protein Z052_00975 [Halorubrum sp. C191]
MAARRTDGNDLFVSDVIVYIEALYISEPHRDQGYGSQLVERVENWARMRLMLIKLLLPSNLTMFLPKNSGRTRGIGRLLRNE